MGVYECSYRSCSKKGMHCLQFMPKYETDFYKKENQHLVRYYCGVINVLRLSEIIIAVRCCLIIRVHLTFFTCIM